MSTWTTALPMPDAGIVRFLGFMAALTVLCVVARSAEHASTTREYLECIGIGVVMGTLFIVIPFLYQPA